MANQTDEDIEFIPSDEIVEAEPDGAEDGAVHLQEREEPGGLMVVEDEGFEAEQLDDAEAEEVELEASEAEAEVEEGQGEEHEEDLEEVLRRHYGIVEEEPDEELVREEWWSRRIGAGEFVCRSCFLRKPASQLRDARRGVCVDCATDGT